MTINQAFQSLVLALSRLYDPNEARSIARIVFEDGLRIRQTERADLLTPAKAEMLAMIQRRLLRYEPVQYILGQADFFGLKLKVTPAVLIPRQETEELVAWTLETLGAVARTKLQALDIGTGSGCIAIALQKKRPALSMTAIDISAEALVVARENAEHQRAAVAFHQCDILDPTGWGLLGQFDLIISNPPYIPERERALLPSHVQGFEPASALFVADEAPLRFYATIADFARAHLRAGGYLFFECNEFNAREVQVLLADKGFAVELRQDLNGRDRMIRAWLP